MFVCRVKRNTTIARLLKTGRCERVTSFPHFALLSHTQGLLVHGDELMFQGLAIRLLPNLI